MMTIVFKYISDGCKYLLDLVPVGITVGLCLAPFFKTQIKNMVTDIVKVTTEETVKVVFQEKIENYKDSLGRKTKAFELKLNNEFTAYQDILDFLSAAYINTCTICDLLLTTVPGNEPNALYVNDLLQKLVDITTEYRERVYTNLTFVNNNQISQNWNKLITDMTKICIELDTIYRTSDWSVGLPPDSKNELNTIKTNIKKSVDINREVLKKYISELAGEMDN